jgi:hypothetical protein
MPKPSYLVSINLRAGVRNVRNSQEFSYGKTLQGMEPIPSGFVDPPARRQLS